MKSSNGFIVIYKNGMIQEFYSEHIQESKEAITFTFHLESKQVLKSHIAFYTILNNVPDQKYLEAISIISKTCSKTGYALNEHRAITFDLVNGFLINNEEFVSAEQFEEILFSMLGLSIVECDSSYRILLN